MFQEGSTITGQISQAQNLTRQLEQAQVDITEYTKEMSYQIHKRGLALLFLQTRINNMKQAPFEFDDSPFKARIKQLKQQAAKDWAQRLTPDHLKKIGLLKLDDDSLPIIPLIKWIIARVYPAAIGNYSWDYTRNQVFNPNPSSDKNRTLEPENCTIRDHNDNRSTIEMLTKLRENLGGAEIRDAEAELRAIVEVIDLETQIYNQTVHIRNEENRQRGQWVDALQTLEFSKDLKQATIQLFREVLQRLEPVQKCFFEARSRVQTLTKKLEATQPQISQTKQAQTKIGQTKQAQTKKPTNSVSVISNSTLKQDQNCNLFCF